MAATGIIGSRRNAAQRHAIASVEQEIRAIDPISGRKYLRDYREAFRSYKTVITSNQVRREIAKAGTVLVGDYHALPTAQRYLASLLQGYEFHQRPVAVGVEAIFSRDQHILDRWQRGEIEENEFRQRIRFDNEWGYDWAPFFELLSAARDHGATVYGLDCMPREDLRKIRARDRHAAHKISELRQWHPDALILVLFGESHLAPQHLPVLLKQQLPSERVVTVLQNVDDLYWLAASETGDHVEAVEVQENVLCVFNATPLEKYEHYRLCLDRWGRGNHDRSAPDLSPTLYNLIGSLVLFLGIDQYSPHNTTQPKQLVNLMPEVYSGVSETLLRRLLSHQAITSDIREGDSRETDSSETLLRQLNDRGCVYVETANAICIRDFQMGNAAEDASRFLHHACRGLPNLYDRSSKERFSNSCPAALNKEDTFYADVFEHALAFFGSRILYPARPAFRNQDVAELFDVTREDLEQQTSLPFADAVEALDFLLKQRELKDGEAKAPNFQGRACEYAAAQLGRLTGNDLYDAYLHGRLTPAALRKLFLIHIERPGVAREAYDRLRSNLRTISDHAGQ